MEKSVFRKSSLERISSPEQLNEYIKVANPTVWMIIGALFLLVAAALTWGFLGSMPTTVSVGGVLFPDNALVSVEADGVMGRALVTAGTHVSAGDTMAFLRDGSEIVATQSGTVVSILSTGAEAGLGVPLACILPDEVVTDTVICYYPSTAASIPVGAEAQVSPGSAPRDEHGYIKGKVLSVGTYPVSAQDVIDTLGNAQIAQSLLSGGALVKLVIELERDEQAGDARNPYKWSNKRGREANASAGTLCNVLIVTEAMRPIDYLLGN